MFAIVTLRAPYRSLRTWIEDDLLKLDGMTPDPQRGRNRDVFPGYVAAVRQGRHEADHLSDRLVEIELTDFKWRSLSHAESQNTGATAA